jgi:hypothetical protein
VNDWNKGNRGAKYCEILKSSTFHVIHCVFDDNYCVNKGGDIFVDRTVSGVVSGCLLTSRNSDG